MAKIDIVNPRTGEVIGFGMVADPQPYKRYSYVGFVEALMVGPAARRIVRAKKQDTDAGADVEVFMELIKAQNYVDFNSTVSRLRLHSLVPGLLSQEEADAITGGP